jgi:hypothetical protein
MPYAELRIFGWKELYLFFSKFENRLSRTYINSVLKTKQIKLFIIVTPSAIWLPMAYILDSSLGTLRVLMPSGKFHVDSFTPKNPFTWRACKRWVN